MKYQFRLVCLKFHKNSKIKTYILIVNWKSNKRNRKIC